VVRRVAVPISHYCEFTIFISLILCFLQCEFVLQGMQDVWSWMQDSKLTFAIKALHNGVLNLRHELRSIMPMSLLVSPPFLIKTVFRIRFWEIII